EREVEAAADTQLAFRPDPSSVRFDDAFADGEAEPGAALLPRRGFLDLEELAEDALEILGGDPLALIADDDLVLSFVLVKLQRDLPSRLRELECVRNEVVEH